MDCFEALWALLQGRPLPGDTTPQQDGNEPTPLQLLLANALQTQFIDQSNGRTWGASHDVKWDGTNLIVGGLVWPPPAHQPQLLIGSQSTSPSTEVRSILPSRTVEAASVKSPLKPKAVASEKAPTLMENVDLKAAISTRRNTEVSAQMLDSLGDRSDNFSPRGLLPENLQLPGAANVSNRRGQPRNLTLDGPRHREGVAMKDLLFGDPKSTEVVPQPQPIKLSASDRATVKQAPVAWIVGDESLPSNSIHGTGRSMEISEKVSRLVSPRPPLSHQSPRSLPPETKQIQRDNVVVVPSRGRDAASSAPKGIPFNDVYPAEEKLTSGGHAISTESEPIPDATLCLELEPTVVFFTPNCPLRSISLIHDTAPDDISGIRQYNATFAIGSNAKSIHVFKYEGYERRQGVTHGLTGNNDSIFALNEFADVHKGSVYTSDWFCPDDDRFTVARGILASGSNDKSIRLIRYALLFCSVV